MQPPHRPSFPPFGMPPPPQYQGAPSQPGQYPYQRPPQPHGSGPYGRAGPRPPPPLPPRPPSDGSPPKNTTLWVGKIASSVDALTIRALLEACGKISMWKPATDPVTGALKGFGFCTFVDAEGVIVALEVLNEFMLDGQALALKCNSATDLYIQWFKTAQEKDAAASASDVASAREKVEALTANRPAVANPADPKAAANAFLSSLGGGDGDRRERERDRGGYHRGGGGGGGEGDGRDRHYRRDRDDGDFDNRSSMRKKGRDSEEGEIRENDHQHHQSAAAATRRRSESREPETSAPPAAPAAPVADSTVPPQPLVVVKQLPTMVAPRLPRKRPLTTAFTTEEEEEESEKKTRKLIPIQYSAEEMRAIHHGGDTSGNGAAAGGGAATTATTTTDAAEEQRRQLMAKVPQEKDELFAYSVKWEELDNAPQDAKSKLSGWINKKVKALVGDDADGAGFAEFIVSEVRAHRSAAQILANVQDVLDEDAVEFVMQLFKLLIYQTEELATK